ncbi:phosphatase PAP2 family protein [Carboxylicivirga linearis]|uniref:phosphatase PAP2 family protein n=1 Tax=Carboxylicivirga linearis TaxID=1628157 RepID=UPI001FD624AB|nr:phosphatase PAP2 family protein [Carboxylicivirga linearis]
MIPTLIEIDKDLLMFLNSHFSTYWDNFFWMFTSKEVWIPLYLSIAYVLFKNHGIKGLVTLLFFGLLVALCDQISTNVFKEGFERLRPSHDEELKYLVHLINGKRGGSYGFVSSHATNSFGLAMLSSLLFRNKAYTFIIFAWAAINSYSRIYMGVHFPGDIIGGCLLGIILARIVYEIYLRVITRFIVISHHNKRLLKSGLAESFGKDSRIIFYTIIVMTGTLLLAAKVMLKLVA